MESGPLFVERMFYLKNMKEQGTNTYDLIKQKKNIYELFTFC